MIFLVIFIPALVAYLAAGTLLSRKYHGAHAIEWEKNYQACTKCHSYSGYTSNRNHHTICHDSKGGYIAASVFMIPAWPLLYPILWMFTGGKSLKSFYLSPVNDWIDGQKELIEQKNRYKDQLREIKNISSKATERQILEDAIKGIDAQIIIQRK